MFYTKDHHWILTQEISLKHTCDIRTHVILMTQTVGFTLAT